MYQSVTVAKKRIAVLLLTVMIIAGGLILRVIYLQVFKAEWLKRGAESQRLRAVPILARRGAIYDRLGNELAISIDSDCIYAIPAEIDNPTKTARILGQVLAMDPIKIERLIIKRASFVWIKRKASYPEIKQLREVIKKERLSGIEISQKAQRFYPQSFLASQLIGIAGIDNQGLEGLEKQFDQYLRGIPGSDEAEFDTAGRHIPQGERRYVPPVPGDSLYLTIDENIQYIAERELEKAVNDTGSKRGMAVVVDPKTGDILASACWPKYDPNNFSDYPQENRRSPLYTDMYEPGSTFKVFTTVAALEEGMVTPESSFFDPGYIVVDDRRIKCWKAGGHGSQNFIEALENSCNPVFATLALRLTKEKMYQYIKAFGFGSPTGISFPGESAGMLKPLSVVKNVELANIGFGQGVTVTPIQMVMGVSAIANGGYLLKPRIVREIYGPDGQLKKTYHRQVVRQVLSEKTSKLMAQLMQSVVTNGSGNKAYLPGYRVAGKTGTAQKVVQGQRGYGKQVIASFIGFAPADDPKLVAMVILDEPSSPITYGGVISAPVVGNIFRDALRYLGVQPQYETEMIEKLSEEAVTVPNLLNMSMNDATKTLKQQRLDYRILGEGSHVFDQVPKPGAIIQRGTKVLLYFDREAKFNSRKPKVAIPDLQGLTQLKAEQILAELGLKLQPSGSGILKSQSPLVGTVVDYGSIVKGVFVADPIKKR